MKNKIWIVILIIIAIIIGGSIFIYNKSINNNDVNSSSNINTNELDKLKQYFEEYSGIQIFLKSNATIEQANELANKLKDLEYLHDVKVLSKEDSYNELKNRIGEAVGSIEQFAVSNKIRAKCYYLDDISLLDENTYFEKVKNRIIELDAGSIIDNIATAGILEIYNKEGMEGVEEYIEKSNYIDNKESNTNNNSQDVTKKISDNQVVRSGIIDNIDDNYIYYSDCDSHKLFFEKSSFSYINGRTCRDMDLNDVKIGDYIFPHQKQILVFRNLSGDELNQELLYNLTLTEDERIMFENSVEIEMVNIMGEYNATARITYGDIIGEDLTNEKFTTLVEFNANTKYYNRYVNNIKDVETYSKSNINSVLLKKDSINKKNPPIVVAYDFVDD